MDRLDVLCNVAEISDLGLDSPIPFVLEQKWVVEEEAIGSLVSRRHSCYKQAHQKDGIPRVEPTHKVVAFQSTVHDGSISLLCDSFFGHIVVGPVREPPHVGTDFAKFDGARSVISYRLLEVIVELAIVEKNIGVMIPPIKMAFHRFEGL